MSKLECFKASRQIKLMTIQIHKKKKFYIKSFILDESLAQSYKLIYWTVPLLL